MASIQPFNPAVLHTQGAPITGADVANSFQNSFYAARQDLRAQQGMQNETTRLGMQQEQFAMAKEDRLYDQTIMRPLREQEARIGILGQTLGIKSQEQQLQIGAIGIADQLQRKKLLEDITGEMATYTAATGDGLGKVTSYGYKADPNGDTTSLGTNPKYPGQPTGAWSNALKDTSLAISPDVEEAFSKAGIKQGDAVQLTLANGSTVTRTWDDRTMQDKDAIAQFGKPLRGRFDFYSAKGEHPLDGTGVTAFSKVGATPTYAIAAGASNPVAVVNASMGGEGGRFLARYDQLKVIAETDPRSADGMQARLLMQSMERNPDFQKALGDRDITLNAARNQSIITQSVMGAPAAFVTSFNQRFPQFKINAMPNGQLVPYSAVTQQPLTLQEQGAFASAWDTHNKTYKPDDDTKLGDTVLKEYAKYKSMYEAGKDIPADTKDEKLALQRRQAMGALATMSALELAKPKLAAVRATEEAAALAKSNAANVTPGTGDVGVPVTTPAKTIESLLAPVKNPREEENNMTWNKVKEEVNKKLNTYHPDNGKDGANNPALVMAARIKKGDQAAIEEAMKIFAGDNKEERIRAVATTKTGMGDHTIQPPEAIQAWADGVLFQYGYLDDKGRQPRPAATGGKIKSVTEIKE